MKPFVKFVVPPGAVTVTVLVPATLAGVTAVTVVALRTVTEVAANPPIDTAVVPVKFAPLIVIVVPPAIGPRLGVTVEMVGGIK